MLIKGLYFTRMTFQSLSRYVVDAFVNIVVSIVSERLSLLFDSSSLTDFVSRPSPACFDTLYRV